MIKIGSFLAAMALAACVQGAVTYSWENTAQGLDYEAVSGFTGGAASTFSTTVGVTNGTYSVQIGKDVAVGWRQVAKTFEGGLRPELKDGGTVSFDVTVVQTVAGTIAWNQMGIAYNADAGIGWNQLSHNENLGTAILGTPVTKTVTFTLPDVSDAATYYGLHLIWNSGTGDTGVPGAKADIFIDNMVVTAAPIPEPSLIGLSVLALPLLRRKRK